MARSAGGLGPGEVLGVPALPPARLAAGGERVRAALARMHRGTGLPPVRVLEAALGTLDLAVVATLCELDLPDRLTTPATCGALATELDVDADRLQRLLAYAATRGWVRFDRRDRVHATRATAFLRRDHPGGWRAWVTFAASAEVDRALRSLTSGLRRDGDAFAAANGAPFFTWMQQHPDRHAAFDAAMAAGARMHGLLLARALDWSGVRNVCDVGGGDGTLLRVLAEAHPHLHGTVLDLAEVVARAPAHARITATAGDAFLAVPTGHDTHLFVNVLHDWDDAAAIRLLHRSAAAEPERVIVVESEAHPRPRDGLPIRADVLMLALTPGGRERSTAEVAALAARAGLELAHSTPLVSGDRAHVLTPTPGPREAGSAPLRRA